MNPTLKQVSKLISCLYIAVIIIFTIQFSEATITNFATTYSHHVIFDDLGKLSTGVTYINVAIPLNLTSYESQINLFHSYLDGIINNVPTLSNPNKTFDHIQIQNMQQLIKSITSYAKNRLNNICPEIKNEPTSYSTFFGLGLIFRTYFTPLY